MDNASDVGGSTLDVRVTAAIRARVNPCHGSRRPRRVGYRGRGGPTELAEHAGFADEDRLYQPEESSLVAQLVIDAGATGFVVRDRVDTELVTAVRLTARRERYVSARVARGLQAVCQATGDDGLTRRETEIVRMIALVTRALRSRGSSTSPGAPWRPTEQESSTSSVSPRARSSFSSRYDAA